MPSRRSAGIRPSSRYHSFHEGGHRVGQRPQQTIAPGKSQEPDRFLMTNTWTPGCKISKVGALRGGDDRRRHREWF